MAKRTSFDNNRGGGGGGGGGSKRRKSNDGRPIDRNSNNGSGDGCSVFVGNLKYETKWQALKDHMRRAGNVDAANILEAPSGRSKGCAIVKYQHPREAQRAIEELNESELEGRTIFVQPDNGNPREQRDRDPPNKNYNDRNNDRNNDRYNDRYNDRASDPPRSEFGVYVGNLPYECSWQALKDFFKSCGTIERAEVMEDSKTGRKKGFGVVYFATERAMNNAIQKFDGRDFQGRALEVRKDKKSSIKESDNNASNGNDGFRIFIGNLDFDCSWQDLKDLAQRRCGKVEHADIPNRGWGIVTFASHRDGANAISRLDGFVFKDRKLEARWDRDIKSKPTLQSSKQLYVGNLPFDCSWQNLKDAFKKFGTVSHAEVCETSNGRSTGFGIIAFANSNSAERAMNSMDGAEFEGRKLSVRWDRRPEKLESEKGGNSRPAKREPKPPKNDAKKTDQEDTEMEGNPLDRALSSAR
mmetsp:Transcript_31608/g.74385  ORF Transcript_31608/g.74385 Transcript_31608/m.74385 type:complete len:469 (-) Transcript_31608:408-1814(-)